ncbi:MAG: hypothetical protein AMXMBFR7_18110 [Planctomycetota bacterium]
MKPMLLTGDVAMVLLLVLGAVLTVFYFWLARRESGMARRLRGRQLLLLWGLRGVAALMVVLALARPAVSVVRIEERMPSVALLLDDSASMNFPDARENPLVEARPPAERTRAHTAAELACRLQERLALTHRVRLYTFSDSLRLLREVPHRESEDVPPLSRSDLFPEGFKPAGEYSNVGDAIADSMRELASDRISGLVLLTDGRETGGIKLEQAASEAAAAKVPLHCVALGSEFPLRDLRIDEVVVDADASLGDVLPFRVKVTNQISDPLTVKLTMSEEGKQVSQKTLRLKRGTSMVAIGALLETEGVREFKLSLPKQPDEVNVENNEATVHVSVSKRDLRVLLVSGEPNREYLYMVPALLRDPIVNLSCFLQSADVDYIQQGRTNLEKLPASTEEWNRFDVVILNDVDPNGLDAAQVAGLEALITNGGGLIVTGGYTHGLAKFVQVHAAKVRQLLPVELDRNAVIDHDRIWEKPFKVERTPAGKGHRITLASTDSARDEQIWASFPDLYWNHPVQAVKSKAVTLLQRAGPREEGGGQPLLVVHRYGRGGVLFCGITSLWRWRFPSESFDYDRMMLSAIRDLGQTRLSGAQQQVMLETERRTYAPGEEVKITLRMLDPALISQLENQKVFVAVESSKQKDRQMVELKSEGPGHPLYRGNTRARETGSILLSCRQAAPNADSEAKPLFDVKHNYQVRMESLEDRDTSANLEGLRAAAEQTGGVYYDYRNIKDLEALPPAIPTEPQILSQEVQVELWDGTMFLLVFLILVCVEWSMRKWWGLL